MITTKQAAEATARLAVLVHYPGDPIARAEIGDMLLSMVGTPAQLEWLISTMRDRVGKWEGPRELRGVFCTKFKPLDGIEATSTMPGFTPEDSEQLYLQDMSAERFRELSAPRSGEGMKKIESGGIQ